MSRIHFLQLAELKVRLDRRDPIQLVNVEAQDRACVWSIPGSHRIPLQELKGRSSELKKNLEVVVYGADRASCSSRLAADVLEPLGFCVSVYEGGVWDWKKSNYPLEAYQEGYRGEGSKTDESAVDHQLEESFPASDPPSWSGVIAR